MPRAELKIALLGLVTAGAFLVACFGLLGWAAPPSQIIAVASTTSTKDSGLFDYLLPLFRQRTGISVVVTAVGTNEALNIARRGDADAVFVHAKFLEQHFVSQGHGVKRWPVMYNDFVLIGPKSDPAGIGGTTDVAQALRTIRDKGATFISRSDYSGTHLAELALWKDAGINIGEIGGAWYRRQARGMKATLRVGHDTDGYVLSDRGTWLSLRDKGNLQILVEGDRRLFNQYSVIMVNPDKHPHVKKEVGQRFIDWLTSPEGQQAIGDYKINGERLFFPNARDPDA